MRIYLSILVALPVIIASGCHLVVGPEDDGWWYCDSTGCYSCTPVGCEGLPAGYYDDYGPYDPSDPCAGPEGCSQTPDTPNPTNGSCKVSADCKDGFVCKKEICVPGKPGPCETHDQCGDGSSCNDGICQDTGLCSSDGECVKYGTDYVCDSRGSCVAPEATKPAPTCESADSCETGICVSGGCASCSGDDCGLEKTQTCQFDKHCGADRRCLDGQCTASCADDPAAACATGQICKAGLCVTDTSIFCTSSSDCTGDSSLVCVNNGCYPSCTATGTCANGQDQCGGEIETAEGNKLRICRPDPSAQLECSLTSDCANSEVCTNGVCRTSCTEDKDCAACEDGPVCGVGGFCMTDAEANPGCAVSADCEDPKICLDAQCVALP